jgi:hypothetical protein
LTLGGAERFETKVVDAGLRRHDEAEAEAEAEAEGPAPGLLLLFKSREFRASQAQRSKSFLVLFLKKNLLLF